MSIIQGVRTYATTTRAATTATTTATTAGGAAAASGLGSLVALLGRFGLAGKLNRNLTVEDGLAVQFTDGTLSLSGGRDVNEGVADRTGGARVGGDGSGLAACKVSTGKLSEKAAEQRTQGSP